MNTKLGIALMEWISHQHSSCIVTSCLENCTWQNLHVAFEKKYKHADVRIYMSGCGVTNTVLLLSACCCSGKNENAPEGSVWWWLHVTWHHQRRLNGFVKKHIKSWFVCLVLLGLPDKLGACKNWSCQKWHWIIDCFVDQVAVYLPF